MFGTLVAMSAALDSPSSLAQPTTPARAAPVEFGRWLTESGNLEVEIAPCGAAICGTVVKVIANRSMTGSGEMAADAQAALGMKILIDLVPSGGGEWSGQIYNRENGKTYSCKVSLVSQDELSVKGYVFLPIIGKTQIWRRIPAPAATR